MLLYTKDHGEALLDKYPISTVVSCEREVSDDDGVDTSKEHGFGLWGDHDNTLKEFVGKRINHIVAQYSSFETSCFQEFRIIVLTHKMIENPIGAL